MQQVHMYYDNIYQAPLAVIHFCLSAMVTINRISRKATNSLKYPKLRMLSAPPTSNLNLQENPNLTMNTY